MSTCIGCSAEIELTASFCPKCGTPNPESPTITPAEHAAETEQIPPDELKRRLQAALGKDFVLGHMLGEGGFAVVFAAQDRKLSRRIAVKVLRPELGASKSTVQRFVREAESAANLSHPHILPIFFVGEGEGLVYFGMPLVDGETLEQRLAREKQLPEPEVARIGAEIAEALAEAHAAGLVHRDVKPANVLLQGPKKRVMVADFGIAKASGASGGKLTGTGSIIGSPHYMSPEQAAGSQDVDHRSDIYSLGVVLWQMLAGELPFDGPDTQAILVQHLTQPLPPLAKKRPGVSTALLRIVECCCQKKPQHRFATAAEVVEALRGGALPRHRGRPSRVRAAGVAAGVVALAGVAVWALAGKTDTVAARPGAVDAARPMSPMVAVLPFEVSAAGDTAQVARQTARSLANTIAARFGVETVDINRLLGQWVADRRRLTDPLDSNARFAYELSANQLVVGSVFEAGASVRLTADIYDTRSLSRIGHAEINGMRENLLGLLDRVAESVAIALCRQPAFNPNNLCFDAPARAASAITTPAGPGFEGAGETEFHVLVSPAGAIADVRPAVGVSAEAMTAAMPALRAARFEPARKSGRAVEAWASVQVAVETGRTPPPPSRAPAPAPRSDSLRPQVSAPPVQTANRCDQPAVSLANANRGCYDTRPVPRTAPLLALPPGCGSATPANVLLRVSAQGEVVGMPALNRASSCPSFSGAAIALATDLTFTPAMKNGVAVTAWAIVQVRAAKAS